MTHYFSPSDNENMMLEDLPKFEDSKFLQDELKPKHEVQNFKTRAYFLSFWDFYQRYITLFKRRV